MKVRLTKMIFYIDQQRHKAGEIMDIDPKYFSENSMEKLDEDEAEEKPKKSRSKKKAEEPKVEEPYTPSDDDVI